MKKFDLIHTTVLIVAILAGYSALQYIITAISVATFSHSYSNLNRNRLDEAIGFLVVAALFAAITFILIKNGRKCADLILKYDPETEFDDAPKFDLDRNNLLFVLFIGAGLYTMIEALPHALNNIWLLFSTKISPANSNALVDGNRIALELLQVTIGALLIYAAPNLTNFIENKIAARGSSSIQPDKKSIQPNKKDV
jgi:hypothetical protein